MGSSYVTLIQPQTWLGEDGWDNQGSGNSRQKSRKKGDIKITKKIGKWETQSTPHAMAARRAVTLRERWQDSLWRLYKDPLSLFLVPSPKSSPSELSLGIGG